MEYTKRNKNKDEQTANPKKYPQGYFKDKKCKDCSNTFSPKAPSEFYCSDKCKDRGLSSRYFRRTYGIDVNEYERMLKEQDSKCKICSGEGWTMQDHHKMKLVIDHCHATGKVRGLLCHNCNRGLGLFKDSIENFIKAIEYLKV